MKDLSKEKMCKLCKKGVLKDNFDEYAKLVGNAKFICTKCGRAADNKSNLCKVKKV